MALWTRVALLVLLLDVVDATPHLDKGPNKDMSSLLPQPKGLRTALLVLQLHVVVATGHMDQRTNRGLSSLLVPQQGLKNMGQPVTLKKQEALQPKNPQAKNQESGLRWKRGRLLPQHSGLATITNSDYKKDLQ